MLQPGPNFRGHWKNMSKTLVTCGCGRHMVAPETKYVVLWNGQYWDTRCAFQEACAKLVTKRPSNKRLMFFKRLVEEHVPCCACDQPIGHNYEIVGNNVYHKACLYDLGGSHG